MVLDTLLFKIVPHKVMGEPKAVLCIPTSKVNIILDFYHNSLSGCHTGVTKTYMTISEWFYCPNLAHHVQAYITSCHVCQLLKGGKSLTDLSTKGSI